MFKFFNRYYPLRNILFFLVESILILSSVIIAIWLRFRGNPVSFVSYEYIFLKALLIVVVCQLSLYYFDLYDFKIVTSNLELGIRLLQSLGVSCIVIAVLYYIFPTLTIGRGIFFIYLFLLVSMLRKYY